MEKLIHDLTDDALKEELLGHAITAVDETKSTLTLDDGRVLKFEDAHRCCAWFSAELKAGNLTSNGITDVVEESWEYNADEDVPESWTLHILAADENVADVHIEGDSTNGHYCRSIALRITSEK